MENLKRHLEYKEDFLLFAKNEANILTPFGVKKVELYNFQLDLLESIKDTGFDLIAHSRQMGVTNLLALYIAWVAIFDEDKRIGLMSSNRDAGSRLLERVVQILQNYSIKEYFDFDKEFTSSSKYKLQLKNGNLLGVLSPGPDSLRGMRIHKLIIDEAAYIKKLSEILKYSTMMFAIQGSKIILASSPKRNSHFNKMVLNYEEDKSIKEDKNISLNYLPWNLHPNRDKEWFEKQCIILGLRQELINEELNCVVTSDEHEQKNKTISLRLTNKWLIDIKTKIGDELSISDYIRGLIEKDLGV
jgi:predicted DNA binding CopG/RHH family protein